MKFCSGIRITKRLTKSGYVAECRVGKESGRPSLGLPTCRSRALLHARLVPSAGDRYPDDPELSDAMDARFADIDSGKPSGAARGGEAVSAHAC